jgi:hypothetical protein
MGRVALTLAVLAAVAASIGASADGAANAQTSFAFGRTGGNIIPYTVTISAAGAVRVTGPADAGKKQVTARQRAQLILLASQVRFATLPKTTLCAGVLPDVAATFVRVGTHRVLVHGDCVPRYRRMWLALGKAVGLAGA